MDSLEWALCLIIVLKLVRRFIWNIFKLEVEHLTNSDGFRATRNMPLPYQDPGLHERALNLVKQWQKQRPISVLERLKRSFICDCCARRPTFDFSSMVDASVVFEVDKITPKTPTEENVQTKEQPNIELQEKAEDKV